MFGRLNSISKAKNQFFASSAVFLLLLNWGIITGWISPIILLLTSDESPLPLGKITMDEISWIASIVSIGGLLGNFSYGFIISWLGRKWATIVISVPLIGSWFLIAFAQNVYYLYIARFIQGLLNNCILMTVPVYLVEIANDDIRGILSSVCPLGLALGVLLAYTSGNYFNYFTTPIFAIILTTIFAVIFPLFPDTPADLVRRNRIKEAEKSLRFYKQIPKDDVQYMQLEIEKLRNAIGISISEKNNGNQLHLSDFTTKAGKRGMIIVTILGLLNQLSGLSTMLTYSSTIFEASGSAFSPNTSTMIVGIVKVLGTCVITPLIDIAGRRFLYITSCIGTATAELILGIYMTLHFYQFDVEAYNWIPIVAFSSALFLGAFAITSLALQVTAEIMPEKLKNFGMAYVLTIAAISNFIQVKYLPMLSSVIGFHGCIFFFATICVLCGLFIMIFLPETKGKSYEEIMNSVK